ncbi:MAG: hypothetical protein ACRD1Q_00275, partial [Vicinamibacterales bacterium]
MTNCPTCAQRLGEHDAVCRFCGRAVSADATPGPPVVAHQESSRVAVADGKAPTAPPNKHRNPKAYWRFAPAALVGGGAGVLLLVFMNGGQGSSTAQPLKGRADAGAVSASSSNQIFRQTAPAMKWNQVKQSAWGRDGSKTVAFELPAEGDVPVWMKRVRPLLVVRCLSRNTEVFVVTSSAASFEKNSGRHTVHLGFDGSGETKEEWEDSVDSQQLFAPDGVGLARRISEARTMTFRFTPFNASPVTAEFNVGGFDEHIQAVAKTCR